MTQNIPAVNANPYSRVSHTVSNRLPTHLFTAIPTDDLPLMLTEFRKSWIQESRSLLLTCEQALGMDLSGIKLIIDSYKTDQNWSPGLYSMIANLRIGIEKNDISKVMDALFTFKNSARHNLYDAEFRIESIGTEWWEPDFISVMRQYQPKGKNGESTLVLPIVSMDIEPVRQDILKALDNIKSVDPKLMQEFNDLVTRIKLFQGQVLRGETNTRVFGSVFFRLAPTHYDQNVYWIEHLVHEISHLRLELLRVHDVLILNDSEPKYEAPFRRDPRPMLGVLHATFVLARILRSLRLLEEETQDSFYRERFEYLKTRFEVGIRSMSNYAEFTALGRQLFDSLEPTALSSK